MRHLLLATALVAATTLVACKDDAPAAPSAATVPDAAPPAPAPAPAAAVQPATEEPSAPAVAAMSDEDFQRLATLAVTSLKCTGDWRRTNHVTDQATYDAMVASGLAVEMHDVAMAIAAEELAKRDAPGEAKTDAERVARDYAAIASAKDSGPNDRRVEAVAWLAYFSDRAAGGTCAPAPELLQRIGK
jgi:hypothetical protein